MVCRLQHRDGRDHRRNDDCARNQMGEDIVGNVGCRYAGRRETSCNDRPGLLFHRRMTRQDDQASTLQRCDRRVLVRAGVVVGVGTWIEIGACGAR